MVFPQKSLLTQSEYLVLFEIGGAETFGRFLGEIRKYHKPVAREIHFPPKVCSRAIHLSLSF